MQILRIRNAPNIEIAFTKKWTDKIKEFQQGNGEVRKKAGGKD
jgi:hypothetical protein